LQQAADYMINHKLAEIGGAGGLIAVDKDGNISTPFNTDGMFRGFIKSSGEKEIAIYKN
jgi:beta-aspartyl-peptidase (threonine type)